MDWSISELTTLKAIAQTYYPSTLPTETVHASIAHLRVHLPTLQLPDPLLQQYFHLTLSDADVLWIAHKLTVALSRPLLFLIKFLLWVLNWKVVIWLCTRTRWAVPFSELPLEERASLLMWAAQCRPHAPLAPLLAVHQVLFKFASLAFYTRVTHIDAASGSDESKPRRNPTWDVMQYPGPRGALSTRVNTLPHSLIEGVPSHFTLLGRDIPLVPEKHGEGGHVELFYDALVVGTGAGGGVIASYLAQLGLKLLVIEKGTAYHGGDTSTTSSTNQAASTSTGLSLSEQDSYEKLFEREGLCLSEDGSIAIMAGSTMGGGTAINWSASLQTPHYVREEWAQEFGLTTFQTDEFQHALDRVCDRIGVTTDGVEGRHNAQNQILLDGCRKLGYPTATVPQNTRGKDHSECGWCCFGCPSGTKQGTKETYLKDAAKCGAHFLMHGHVDRVLWNKNTRKASGVEARVRVKAGTQQDGEELKLRIYAKTVVVSAGSLHTPAILKRSGFQNKHIGKNLRLHPVIAAVGIFPQKINPFHGAALTTISSVCDTSPVDGKHYGAKLETPAFHTVPLSMSIPPNPCGNHALNETSPLWKKPLAEIAYLRTIMPMYAHCSSVFALQRDRDSVGEVILGPNQEPRVKFSLSKHDAKSMTVGLEKCMDVLVAAGARHILSGVGPLGLFSFPHSDSEPASITHPLYQSYMARLRSLGVNPPFSASIFSAHQMGTARMAASPDLGACKPTGELWECNGVWVCDASLFPTASGVNPMVTVMAVADVVARKCVESIESEQE